jgi:hypothetical protein
MRRVSVENGRIGDGQNGGNSAAVKGVPLQPSSLGGENVGIICPVWNPGTIVPYMDSIQPRHFESLKFEWIKEEYNIGRTLWKPKIEILLLCGKERLFWMPFWTANMRFHRSLKRK